MPAPGALLLGPIPLVVGVIRTRAALAALPPEPANCDVLELRVDLLGPDAPWRDAARRCREAGLPVLFTARQTQEGGEWAGDEPSRLEMYRSALPDVSAIDVELRSGLVADLLPAARAAGVRVIGSFHDFTGTPSSAELATLVQEGRSLGVDVVKLATFLGGRDDLGRLAHLSEQFPRIRLCLLGMGPLGAESRVALPLAGSCLTYGFADTASAPGQLSVGDLRIRLAEAHPGYRRHLQAQRA